MDGCFGWNDQNVLLVGDLEQEFYFSIQLGIIIPTDFHIFQRGMYTTNQIMVYVNVIWLNMF